MNFGCIEDGLYRGALPTQLNVSFLDTLNLKTLILLEPIQGSESVDPIIRAFLDDNGISFVRIGSDSESGNPSSPATSQSMSEELVLAAMREVKCLSFIVYIEILFFLTTFESGR